MTAPAMQPQQPKPPPDDAAEQAKKDARKALRLAPEAIGAMALSAIWPFAFLAVGPSLALIITIIVLSLLGVGATILTIHTGSQGLLVCAGGYVAVLALAAISALDLSSVGVVACSSTVVVYLDLMRLSFARRRTENLDERIVMRTLAATGVVTALSVGTIVAAFMITGGQSDGDGSRSWLWVPIATAVIVIPGLALVIASARKAQAHDKRRWSPGERMLPQPNVD